VGGGRGCEGGVGCAGGGAVYSPSLKYTTSSRVLVLCPEPAWKILLVGSGHETTVKFNRTPRPEGILALTTEEVVPVGCGKEHMTFNPLELHPGVSTCEQLLYQVLHLPTCRNVTREIQTLLQT